VGGGDTLALSLFSTLSICICKDTYFFFCSFFISGSAHTSPPRVSGLSQPRFTTCDAVSEWPRGMSQMSFKTTNMSSLQRSTWLVFNLQRYGF